MYLISNCSQQSWVQPRQQVAVKSPNQDKEQF